MIMLFPKGNVHQPPPHPKNKIQEQLNTKVYYQPNTVHLN